MAKKEQYINNSMLLKALVDYKKLCRYAKREDKPLPPIPDYIGECFLKIGQHLSYKPNFINYTFRDDMIGDGIENCLRYLKNFNPSKSKNPFAYFTQIMFYAFLRRIQGEKKQLYIKYKTIQNSSAFDESARQMQDDGTYDMSYLKFLQRNMGHIIKEFEASKSKKSKTKIQNKKPKGIENFFAFGDDPSCAEDDTVDDVECSLKFPCA